MHPNYYLRLLGEPGAHAWLVFAFTCLNYFPVAFNHLAMAIYGARPPHRCNLPEGRWVNTSIPQLEGGKTDSCVVWVNYTAASNQTEECPDGWHYQLGDREGTIVSEWDLVCNSKHMSWTTTSIYFAGVMVGGLIFGTLSDKIGRLPVMVFTLFMPLLLGTMLFFVENLVLFIIIRCLIGVLMQGLQTTSYVLGMELFCVSKYRAITAALFETCWALGVMALAGIAYFLRHWRWIQLGITLPTILSLLYIWFIPESTRWLLTRKKYKRAKANLARSAKFNKVQLPDNLLSKEIITMETQELEDDTKKYNFFDMFKTPKLRIRSLVMFYVWLATALGYYGLSLNASAFGGNKYLNFFISGAVELPAYFSGVWILAIFGRKKPLMTYFLLGGVCCIIAGVIPKETSSGSDIKWVSTMFAWIGKFSTAGCWSVIFLYASEIYPTVIRNVGVGACAFWARVGSLIAPQILSIADYTKPWVPIVILGIIAILAGLLTILLPETMNRKLPDTIEEAEDMLDQGFEEDSHANSEQNNKGYVQEKVNDKSTRL